MDPKIKCLTCGSYIHDADHCWNWCKRRWCRTDNKYKESCDCDDCIKRDVCQYCNNWTTTCSCIDEEPFYSDDDDY